MKKIVVLDRICLTTYNRPDMFEKVCYEVMRDYEIKPEDVQTIVHDEGKIWLYYWKQTTKPKQLLQTFRDDK